MSTGLLTILVLGIIGFFLMRIILQFIPANGSSYSFRRDMWVYITLLSAAGIVGIYYFAPDYADSIIGLFPKTMAFVLFLSFLIYFAFLLETPWLFYTITATASLGTTFFWPENALVFEGFMPPLADHLSAALLLFIFTVGTKLINGVSGIFSLFAVTICGGAAMIAIIGGLPLILGFIGAYWAGLWLGHLNVCDHVRLNNGICASMGFLLGWMLLSGCIELAGPSMLILPMFLFAEICWALWHRFILNDKKIDLSENTAYGMAYEKGLSEAAIRIAVGKIGIVNIIFAGFQLFASNFYSVPIFVFLANIWLLNILSHVGLNDYTLQETNRQLIKSIKSGIDDFKKSISKRKRH